MIGRSRVIRTLDPLLPKQVRYQAALYSGMVRQAETLAMRRVITAVPLRFKRFRSRFFRASPIIAKRRQTVYEPRQLGRRQVVRHRFLVPAFLGSNPSAPANPHQILCRPRKTGAIALKKRCRRTNGTRNVPGPTCLKDCRRAVFRALAEGRWEADPSIVPYVDHPNGTPRFVSLERCHRRKAPQGLRHD